jgi:hypothetical protein
MEAAIPRCDRLTGPLATRGPCCLPLRWVALTDPMEGVWCCAAHGPMMDGTDAAMRAGFLAYVYVEPDAA